MLGTDRTFIMSTNASIYSLFLVPDRPHKSTTIKLDVEGLGQGEKEIWCFQKTICFQNMLLGNFISDWYFSYFEIYRQMQYLSVCPKSFSLLLFLWGIFWTCKGRCKRDKPKDAGQVRLAMCCFGLSNLHPTSVQNHGKAQLSRCCWWKLLFPMTAVPADFQVESLEMLTSVQLLSWKIFINPKHSRCCKNEDKAELFVWHIMLYQSLHTFSCILRKCLKSIIPWICIMDLDNKQ